MLITRMLIILVVVQSRVFPRSAFAAPWEAHTTFALLVYPRE
jgi:hypothetical protein